MRYLVGLCFLVGLTSIEAATTFSFENTQDPLGCNLKISETQENRLTVLNLLVVGNIPKDAPGNMQYGFIVSSYGDGNRPISLSDASILSANFTPLEKTIRVKNDSSPTYMIASESVGKFIEFLARRDPFSVATKDSMNGKIFVISINEGTSNNEQNKFLSCIKNMGDRILKQ